MTGFIAVPATPPEVMDVKVNSEATTIMAGNAPVTEASSIVVPSLVVAAETSALTSCAVAGFVNCAKLKTT